MSLPRTAPRATRRTVVSTRRRSRSTAATGGLVIVVIIVALVALRRPRKTQPVAVIRPAVAEPVVASRRGSTRRSPIRSLLAAAGVLGAGVLVAVIAAGGTYAIWNDTAPVAATTIQSGSTGLTVNNQNTFSVDLRSTPLLPGRSVVPAAPIVLKNTGVTPLNATAPSLSYTPGSSALSPYLTVSMRTASGPTCTPTPVTTPLPAAIAPIPFSIGQSVAVCIEIRLAANAPSSVQNATAEFLINLTATQVRP